ncbi:hypothetical protein JXO52_10855 [bacterium]|nr:hypothetical protein [bacterium]
MRKLLLPFIFLAAVLLSCTSDNSVNVFTDTARDTIGDITWLNGVFYTTNVDTSTLAGPQIVLYTIADNGRTIQSLADLKMNGQGYLAITNDGHNLYLQSRRFNTIMKRSPAGEPFYNREISGAAASVGSGICCSEAHDSLLVLSRPGAGALYELRCVNKDDPSKWTLKASAPLPGFDSGTGAYAIDLGEDDLLYILGRDTADTDVLLLTDMSLAVQMHLPVPADTLTGLCFRDTRLYWGFRDKTVAMADPID